MKKLFIACFYFIMFFQHVECKAECVTSLYEVQQSLFTYIYLIRQDPLHFNSYIKNMHDELKILRDIDKAISIVPDMLKPIDIKTRLSFNEGLYILQREQQYAIVMDEKEDSNQIKSAAFIISNYSSFKDKILLILSTTEPVQLIIISFDRCFSMEMLFNSMSPAFAMYRDDISRPFPLWKVVLKKNDIDLYEYHKVRPYSFNKLLGH